MTHDATPEAAASGSDVGLATLGIVHQRLMIDEEWTERGVRQFTWTGYRLAQTVGASPIVMSRDMPVSLIVIRTPVVTDVATPLDRVEEALALRNYFAVGSAYLLRREERAVDLVCAHTIHDETLEFRSDQLADFAILQLCEAERDAETLAAACRGRIAEYTHPIRGSRLVPDDMLNVVDECFVPKGSGESCFRDRAELQKVCDYYRGSPLASFDATSETVCVEVPFGPSDTSLVELRADVTHPWLGSGLAVVSAFRAGQDIGRLYGFAGVLQQLQLQTTLGGGQCGAWAVRVNKGDPVLAFSRFVPNAMFRQDLVLDVAIGEVNRALWVDGVMFPDLPPRNAWDVIRVREEPTEYPH